jgi:hypothetical protein
MNIVKVKNFPDRMYAERARQSLDEEGIPSLIQSSDIGFLGAGGAAGLPVSGADIFVAADMAERAKEILNELFDGI